MSAVVRVLVLLAVLLSTASTARAGEVLTIGMNNVGSHPYVIGSGGQLHEPPGLAVDVLHEVGQRLGIDVRFVRMPGQRVLHELKSGRIDGALLFSHSTEREGFGAYPMRDGQPDSTRRLATLSYMLYRRQESALDWDGARFRNLQGAIGASRHYSVVRDLERLGVQVVEVPSITEAFRMLRAGRIEGVADHGVVADAHIAATGITWAEKVTPSLSDKDYYLLLSHQYVSATPARATAIWNLVGELRDRITQQLLPQYVDRP